MIAQIQKNVSALVDDFKISNSIEATKQLAELNARLTVAENSGSHYEQCLVILLL